MQRSSTFFQSNSDISLVQCFYNNLIGNEGRIGDVSSSSRSLCDPTFFPGSPPNLGNLSRSLGCPLKYISNPKGGSAASIPQQQPYLGSVYLKWLFNISSLFYLIIMQVRIMRSSIKIMNNFSYEQHKEKKNLWERKKNYIKFLRWKGRESAPRMRRRDVTVPTVDPTGRRRGGPSTFFT